MSNDPKMPLVVETLMAHDLSSVTSETVTFIRSDGTADAGEAAGTIVYGKLDKAPVLNLLGDAIGEYNDVLSTSIAFTTGVMDSTREVGFVSHGSLNERLTRTADILNAKSGNGWWACDYKTGLLVIKKATTGTSQVITSYKIRSQNTSSSGGGGTSALPVQATTATTSNVASSASNVTLLAANANRKGATFYNDSTQVLYLKFGATATSSSYTVQLAAGAYYEIPVTAVYTGIIAGIWASANGNCRVTELT